MKLESKDFQECGLIPSEFACDGRNISPQLSWDDVPQDVKSFALSLTDPDAPGGNFIHWLIHDIPKDTRSIELASVPKGARQVENDFRKRDTADLALLLGHIGTFSGSTPLTLNTLKPLAPTFSIK